METTAGRQLRAVRHAVAAAFLAATSAAAFAQVWTQTSAPLTNWTAIASSADGSKLVATANGGLFTGNVSPIYISTNSGASWTQTSASITNLVQSVAFSADGMKLVASGAAGLYTSSDLGVTWMWRTNLSFRSLASSADSTRLVGGGNGTWTSSDSGVTWIMATFGAYCVASSADGTRLAMGTFAYNGFPSGGIFISTNAGADWTQASAPLAYWTGWTSLASAADGTKLFATIGHTYFPTGPGPIFLSPDSGSTWSASASATSHWSSIACSADGMKLVAAGAGGVFTSVDSGTTWLQQTNVPPNEQTWVASSADGNKLVAAVNGGGIWIFQSTPAPKLNLTRSGSNVIISWIVPSMNFGLQENLDLNSTNWVDVTDTPTLNFTNLQNQIILPVFVGNRFYLLKH